MCLSVAIDRPDDVLAKGEHKGFQWMIVHNGSGYRCGYVRVPQGHPWHGKDYDDLDVDVHGGLTFAAPDKPCDEKGEDNAWWLGFDCAHADDAPDALLPGGDKLSDFYRDLDVKVRSQEYVEAECRSLCEQAANAN